MSSIVAIGGGEIADAETKAIDEQVVAAVDVSTPTALFIPTASGDAEGYCETFREYYSETLGCDVAVLRLVDADLSLAAIESRFIDADIIYVGGGDTGFMLDVWRTREIVSLLRRAWKQGTLLTGLSAGALCWAAGGLSDAIVLDDIEYGPIGGLGFLDWLHLTVHATPERRAAFGTYLMRRGVSGIALENNAALEVTDGRWRLLTSSPNAFAYRLMPENGSYTVEPLPRDGTFRPLSELR
jgi:dipeptidase E